MPPLRNSFDAALAHSLARIQAGASTVEACLEEYPQHPELGDLLQLAEVMRTVTPPTPDPVWFAQSRARLETMKLSNPPKSTTLFALLVPPNALNVTRDYFLKPLVAALRPLVQQPKALQMAEILLVSLMGYSGLSSMAAEALPDSPVYAVKRLNEQVELMAADGDGKAVLHLEHAVSRLAELHAVAAMRDEPAPAALAASFGTEVQAARAAAAKGVSPAVAEQVNALTKQLANQEFTFQGTLNQVTDQQAVVAGSTMQIPPALAAEIANFPPDTQVVVNAVLSAEGELRAISIKARPRDTKPSPRSQRVTPPTPVAADPETVPVLVRDVGAPRRPENRPQQTEPTVAPPMARVEPTNDSHSNSSERPGREQPKFESTPAAVVSTRPSQQNNDSASVKPVKESSNKEQNQNSRRSDREDEPSPAVAAGTPSGHDLPGAKQHDDDRDSDHKESNPADRTRDRGGNDRPPTASPPLPLSATPVATAAAMNQDKPSDSEKDRSKQNDDADTAGKSQDQKPAAREQSPDRDDSKKQAEDQKSGDDKNAGKQDKQHGAREKDQDTKSEADKTREPDPKNKNQDNDQRSGGDDKDAGKSDKKPAAREKDQDSKNDTDKARDSDAKNKNQDNDQKNGERSGDKERREDPKKGSDRNDGRNQPPAPSPVAPAPAKSPTASPPPSPSPSPAATAVSRKEDTRKDDKKDEARPSRPPVPAADADKGKQGSGGNASNGGSSDNGRSGNDQGSNGNGGGSGAKNGSDNQSNSGGGRGHDSDKGGKKD